MDIRASDCSVEVKISVKVRIRTSEQYVEVRASVWRSLLVSDAWRSLLVSDA